MATKVEGPLAAREGGLVAVVVAQEAPGMAAEEMDLAPGAAARAGVLREGSEAAATLAMAVAQEVAAPWEVAPEVAAPWVVADLEVVVAVVVAVLVTAVAAVAVAAEEVVARRERREGTGRLEPLAAPPARGCLPRARRHRRLQAREGSSLPDRAGARLGR